MVLVSEKALRDVPYRVLVGTLQTTDRVTRHTARLAGYVTEVNPESPFRKRDKGGIDPAQARGGSPLPGLQRLSRLVAATEELQAFQSVVNAKEGSVREEIDRRIEEAPQAYGLLQNLKGRDVGNGWLRTFADKADDYYPPEGAGIVSAPALITLRRPLNETVLATLGWIAETIPPGEPLRMSPSEITAQRDVILAMLGGIGRRRRDSLPRGQALASLYTVLSHLMQHRGTDRSFANMREEEVFEQIKGTSENVTESSRQMRIIIGRIVDADTPQGNIWVTGRQGGRRTTVLGQRSLSLVSTL